MITLLVIILGCWFTPLFYRYFLPYQYALSDSSIDEIRAFSLSRMVTDPRSSDAESPDEPLAASYNPGYSPVEYFEFDPNGLAVIDWKRLGLSEKQIRVIKNYESKGGRFHQADDLKKIYSISDGDFARLSPYIRIKAESRAASEKAKPNDAEKPVRVERTVAPSERRTLSIDLNTADSLELQQLPGIGPAFSARIVRFRDALGGFHDSAQLLDVYGMEAERYERIKDNVYVIANSHKLIPINSADYETLRVHPLIKPRQANAIIQYRKQHGDFKTKEDLLKIVTLDEEFLRSIAPYISLDP